MTNSNYYISTLRIILWCRYVVRLYVYCVGTQLCNRYLRRSSYLYLTYSRFHRPNIRNRKNIVLFIIYTQVNRGHCIFPRIYQIENYKICRI